MRDKKLPIGKPYTECDWIEVTVGGSRAELLDNIHRSIAKWKTAPDAIAAAKANSNDEDVFLSIGRLTRTCGMCASFNQRGNCEFCPLNVAKFPCYARGSYGFIFTALDSLDAVCEEQYEQVFKETVWNIEKSVSEYSEDLVEYLEGLHDFIIRGFRDDR